MSVHVQSDGDAVERLVAVAAETRRGMQTMEDLASDFVREAILQGLYRPGERLPQDAIAKLLGMSRMPVRASLRKLETEGLVVFHPYRGATVRLLVASEIEEIYHLRVLLEAHLLELAAESITPEAVAELEGLADRILEADGWTGTWVEGRVGFYDRLYSYADRPRMTALVRSLRREVGPYLLLRDELGAGAHDHHLDVLGHLRSGGVALAVDALVQHLTAVSLQLQGLVEEMTVPQ